MIITRTPFRVSLFGGGTDHPWWFNDNGGLVVGMAIDKYGYISCRNMPQYFDYKTRLSYSKIETVKHNEEIEHKAINSILKSYNIDNGLEISYVSDIPAKTGIGSSSSFAVGLINALHAMFYRSISKADLATQAIYIEQQVLKENVGCQDQIWAAYGGLNSIRFNKKIKNSFSVSPLILRDEFEKKLLDSLVLIYTENERISSSISGQYLTPTSKKEDELKSILEIAEESLDYFRAEDLTRIGHLLHKSWEIKRGMHQVVSNIKIDDMYNKARSLGALGGKLLGAGGGGFLLIMAEGQAMKNIREQFKYQIQVQIKVDYEGSKLLYFER